MDVNFRKESGPCNPTSEGRRIGPSSGRRARYGSGWASVCLVSLLVGCTTAEPIGRSTQDAETHFRARDLADEGLRHVATQPGTGFQSWPPAQWDARALDLAAIYFNPTLEVARARWQVARAAVVTAGELPNPTLNIGPQFVSNAMAGVPGWVVASSLAQIIETAGKRDFRVARARYLAESARFDVLNTGWETIGAVNSALLDIAVARSRIAALDRQVAAQSDLAEIAEKRLSAGLGSRLELTTVRTALSRAIIDREAARSGLVEARHQLAQAIGLPVNAIPFDRVSAVLPNSAPTPEFRDRIRKEAPLNRADLLAKLTDYGASETALQLEVAKQYPDIEIGPGYEYDQGEDKWGVSLALPIPIFNQNQGAIGEALAQRRQAADEFIALQAHVIGDVDRAIAAYDSAVRGLAEADTLFLHQTTQLRAQQALFDRGETDRLELLAARAELANAELARVDAEATAAKARLALETAGQLSLTGLDPATWIIWERE